MYFFLYLCLSFFLSFLPSFFLSLYFSLSLSSVPGSSLRQPLDICSSACPVLVLATPATPRDMSRFLVAST